MRTIEHGAVVLAVCCGLVLVAPGAPARSGAPGTLQVLVEPQAGMARIDQYLRGAHHSVDLEIYELADPAVESILAADAARGVRVRVILDRAYVGGENAAAFAYLGAHRVAVRWAPTRFDLDHEKAAVIDDATALVMTMNLTARYDATTRDVVVVDTQPADVVAIESSFGTDWQGGGAAAPAGEDLLWSPGSGQALVELIDSARSTVDVENEEMGDASITDALADAAHRGVKVVVVMTADPAWAGAFDALRGAGVEVRTYPDIPSALYIHAKVVVVDVGRPDERAFVGSENFSVTSLLYNRELGVVTARHDVVETLGRMVVTDAAGGDAWR
ncbi:MAG: phosphatidylserine/phosphatidylglycerophosphate/cardiolipin synthase family protein [Acidimicrobiales bacterium]